MLKLFQESPATSIESPKEKKKKESKFVLFMALPFKTSDGKRGNQPRKRQKHQPKCNYRIYSTPWTVPITSTSLYITSTSVPASASPRPIAGYADRPGTDTLSCQLTGFLPQGREDFCLFFFFFLSTRNSRAI